MSLRSFLYFYSLCSLSRLQRKRFLSLAWPSVKGSALQRVLKLAQESVSYLEQTSAQGLASCPGLMSVQVSASVQVLALIQESASE